MERQKNMMDLGALSAKLKKLNQERLELLQKESDIEAQIDKWEVGYKTLGGSLFGPARIIKNTKQFLWRNDLRVIQYQIAEIDTQISNIQLEIMKNKQALIQGNLIAIDGSTINAPNSVNILGENNEVAISSQTKQEIKHICRKIDKKANELLGPKESKGIKNQTLCIITQLEQNYPKKDVIRSACNILKNILTGVAANQITPLVDSILKMLGA